MKKKFKIEGQELFIETNGLYEDSFEVKSSPLSYKVQFLKSLPAVNNYYKEKFSGDKTKRFVVWDKNVYKLHSAKLATLKDREHLFTATEGNKNMKSVFTVVDLLQQINFTKKETIVSIGGGITQDIIAFTRSIFKRGIDWSFLPTTLLSMADSCIGAKTALNYKGVKNQLALFSAPREVVICEEFLTTLAEREIHSGFGEILKLVITGGTFCTKEFTRIWNSERPESEKIVDLMKLALKIKRAVIEKDEFEVNIRRSLNYGHTIGHAIEPVVSYKIPHGIAVSIGMIIENNIGVRYGFLDKKLADSYNKLISDFVPVTYWQMLSKIDHTAVFNNILQDKKTMSKTINFAIPEKEDAFGIFQIEKSVFNIKAVKSIINETLSTYIND